MTAAERVWPNLLLDAFYVVGLGVAAMFFLASQRATSARWSAALRRVPEALMCTLPVTVLLLIPLIAIGSARHTLFPWSRPGAFAHESALAGKVQYLQLPFVVTRIAVVLAVWVLFALAFRRASLAQDRSADGGLRHHQRLDRLGAGFIVVFALTLTLAAYDWLAALDPGWNSTMFAVYVFAGTFVQAIAAVTLATTRLVRREPLAQRIGGDQLHDLGKMLFAFSVFWAYIWVCQYLLIWYGNIPEEVTHYLTRTRGPWLPLFALNVVLNWIVPFVGLMSAAAKRSPRRLAVVAAVVLAGHWLDLYLVIMPSVWREPRLGLPELALAVPYAALVIFLFRRQLARAPLVPLREPMLPPAPAPHREIA
jgi:hypothetical protein